MLTAPTEDLTVSPTRLKTIASMRDTLGQLEADFTQFQIITSGTGSRGDVFVVRTSKPVEIMGYFDRVDDRVTVSLQILYTANQETEGSQDRLTV